MNFVFGIIKSWLKLEVFNNTSSEAGQIWYDGFKFKANENGTIKDVITTGGNVENKTGTNMAIAKGQFLM